VAEHREGEPERESEEEAPEDRPEEPGAVGGSKSPAADKLPGMPANDDSPLGDTDQHSSEAGDYAEG
jgi:hypothetical protein